MNKSLFVAMMLGLGVVMGFGLSQFSNALTPGGLENTTIEWLENPRPISSFVLTSERGRFDNSHLEGRWTVLLFGYLHCPDVCPTSLASLAQLKRLTQLPMNIVFASVDPDRDSMAMLTGYVQAFHPAFIGITGDKNQLFNLAKSLGVRFKVTVDQENTDVAHSTTFALINPDGVFQGRFRPGFDGLSWVREFESRLNL